MYDGFAVAHNMPQLGDIDLGRLANFIYWHTVKDAGNDDVEKFRAKLWQPPIGVAAHERSPWSPENESKAFSSARTALGLAPAGTKSQD